MEIGQKSRPKSAPIFWPSAQLGSCEYSGDLRDSLVKKAVSTLERGLRYCCSWGWANIVWWEGLATLGPLDMLIGFGHGTKGIVLRHPRIYDVHKKYKNRRLCSNLAPESPVQGTRNLFVKVTMCSRKVWVAGIFRSQNDGGVAERAALEAGSWVGSWASLDSIFGGCTEYRWPYAGTLQKQFTFHFPYRDADARISSA